MSYILRACLSQYVRKSDRVSLGTQLLQSAVWRCLHAYFWTSWAGSEDSVLHCALYSVCVLNSKSCLTLCDSMELQPASCNKVHKSTTACRGRTHVTVCASLVSQLAWLDTMCRLHL